MGATNHTTNYNLSQFVGTDKPAWLTDYNGDMLAIDTAIKAAANDAAAAQTTANLADGTATSAASTASTLNTQINTPSTGLAAVVSQNSSDITALKNLAGSSPLQTVAQTLTGAINEVNTKITPGTVTITAGTGETFSAMLDRLYAAIDTSKVTTKSILKLTAPSNYVYINNISYITAGLTTIQFVEVQMTPTQTLASRIDLQASASKYGTTTISNTYTFSDASSSDASGYTAELIY